MNRYTSHVHRTQFLCHDSIDAEVVSEFLWKEIHFDFVESYIGRQNVGLIAFPTLAYIL